MTEANAAETVIGCLHVAKQFGHVQALRDATVTVPAGRVVALVGDNGAGKSTLLRTLLGLERPDTGEVIIAGRPVVLRSVRDAQALGVDAVHQDLALAPDLSVVDNMFLGHEELGARPWRSFGVLARRRMSEQAASALRDLSIRLPSLSVLEGGFISVIGTLWGACLAVILETGLVISGVSAFWQLIVVGVVLLVAVALDRFTVRRRARARR